mgnify:CR=1 FL=1
MKTQCRHGHDYTEENSYISPAGKRQCRICRAERAKSYREEDKLDRELLALEERKQLRDKRRVLLEGLKEEEEDKRSLAASEEENQRVREERVADAHDRRWERGPEWKEEKEQRIAGILKAAREKAESEIEAPS